MKILITGGAGFIGSHVADEYIKAGHTVAVVDNLATEIFENIHPVAKFYKTDIKNHHNLDRTFKRFKPDVVIHHAAQAEVRRSVDDPLFDAHTNIIGGLNVLECARKYQVKKIIYANTGGALYGEVPPSKLPVKEDYPIYPASPYGMSKFTFENYLDLYSRLYGIKYTSLRYANVYGPRQNPKGEAGVVAIFCGMMLAGQTPKIFGNGRQTRDYVYVGDVARANLLALKKGDNQKINISTGRQTNVNKLFRLVAQKTTFKKQPLFAPAVRGELRRACQDFTLAKKILGWEPLINLDNGVVATIEYIAQLKM